MTIPDKGQFQRTFLGETMITVQMPPIPAAAAPPKTDYTGLDEVITITDAGIDSKIQIPEKKPYLISGDTKLVLGTIDRMTAAGRNPNIIVEGAQGTGKSELAAQYAATRGKPLAVVEIGRVSDPGQIFGYLDLKDRATVFVKGLFTQAITTPNCVVHLQEINRPETDKGLNALFSVLDDNQRSIWIDELQDYIRVAPGVSFFASMNEGFEFIGTMPLDEALRSRFHFKIHLETLPPAQELALLQVKCGLGPVLAQELMSAVSRLRANQNAVYVSTRDIINIADLMSYQLPLEMALKSVIGGADNLMETMRLGNHIAGAANTRDVEHYEYIS